ncbi:hypothetical protein [Brevibacillus panacihumi]|uniref:hypothetical protein n=1 Tax=Brevibacillus panacihumi TaxID=497735 RepID=UPI003D1E62A1
MRLCNPFSYILHSLRNRQKVEGDQAKLVEEKGKKAKAFGILTKLEFSLFPPPAGKLENHHQKQRG